VLFCRFGGTENRTRSLGQGIYNSGALTISNRIVSGNHAGSL